MKAFDILCKYRHEALTCDPSDYKKASEINEAIAELEELLKPKTCDGCKFKGIYDINGTPAQCYSCSRTFLLYDNYEPKEIK